MVPFVFQINPSGNNAVGPTFGGGPDLSYIHGFNDAGGRSDERLGTRGSFTPGVRIMSGGPSRNVPLEAENNNPGNVLFTSSNLKPDMSGEARTNVVGGRPDERLGSRGSFTPGVNSHIVGGAPRDVPLETEIGHGKVLFVSSICKPDLSGEARTNAVRPSERLGSRGSFTPGVRIMSGGPRRDLPTLKATADSNDRGKIIFVSTTFKPDLSGEARTNVVGGRPTERLGSAGSFTPGNKVWLGGSPSDVPLEEEVNPGRVLFVSTVHKPDISGEARTNAVRPTERLGTRGSFTPGARHWLGGQPRDVPAERELDDHGTVLFPSPTFVAHSNVDVERASEVERCEPHTDAVLVEDHRHLVDKNSSAVTMAKENNGGVFRRCGSDSQFSAGAALMTEPSRPAF